MKFIAVIAVLKSITTHPINRKHKVKTILRFLKWNIYTRLNPYPVIYPYTERAKLIMQKGVTGATGNLYVGLNEYTDMAFLLHFLREDDLFIDIGANVGSYTVLASAHIGAQTFSFEPVPSTFTHLIDNIAINRIEHKVAAHNMALGAEPGTISFTQSLGTVNHVALENEADTIQTPIETLDNVLGGQRVPALLKIDVEGFETEVIRGATQTLKQDELKAIIIELNGSGARYGYDEHRIHKTLLDLAFSPFQYDPKERALIPIDTFGTHNTIYIRELDFVQQRVKAAPKIKILTEEI